MYRLVVVRAARSDTQNGELDESESVRESCTSYHRYTVYRNGFGRAAPAKAGTCDRCRIDRRCAGADVTGSLNGKRLDRAPAVCHFAAQTRKAIQIGRSSEFIPFGPDRISITAPQPGTAIQKQPTGPASELPSRRWPLLWP